MLITCFAIFLKVFYRLVLSLVGGYKSRIRCYGGHIRRYLDRRDIPERIINPV